MNNFQPEKFVREELIPQIEHFDFLSNIILENMGDSLKRRGEIDLIIFTPKGVLVCEIKGAKEFKIINKKDRSGKESQVWEYTDHKGKTYTQKFSPYKQVTENTEALRRWVHEKDPRFKKINFAKAVVFPFTDFDENHSGIGDELEITFHNEKGNFKDFVDEAFHHEQNKPNVQKYSDLSEEMTSEIIKKIYPEYKSTLNALDVRESYIKTIKRHLYGPSWEDLSDKQIVTQNRQFTCGSLYPKNYHFSKNSSEEDETNDNEDLETNFKHSHAMQSQNDNEKTEEEHDAFATNFPSSFGITFHVSKNAKFEIAFGFTEYSRDGNNFVPNKKIGKIDLRKLSSQSIDGEDKNSNEVLKNSTIEIVIKTIEQKDCYAVQIYMVNNSIGEDGIIYHQCGLKVSLYEGDLVPSKITKEHYESANLFKEKTTYGKGLNTSIEWDIEKKSVWSEFIPQYRIPRVSPANEKTVADLSLSSLANFAQHDDEAYLKNIQQFVDDYAKHIGSLSTSTEDKENIENAKRFSERLKEALFVLSDNPEALTAFQMMNHAFHLNFLLGNTSKNLEKELWEDEEKLIVKDPKKKPEWRAFQLAFCLAAIPETVYPEQYEEQRKLVDLIWFPTGGGKTEAYNALLCFTIFNRRLNDKNNHGVNVIMRYTLRFLTVDQFNRLATLITSMNLLREKIYSEVLGEELISLGIWVGRASSINKHQDAITLLNETEKASKLRTKDPTFILDECPICKNDLFDDDDPGYVSYKFKKNHTPHCVNKNCKVSEIPVYQAEESTMTKNPSAIIATVDSFAKLSWYEKETNAIFNKNLDNCDPPELIIQDELHLIGGPLGSLVGLYDQLIRDFCSEKKPVKIVGSTATISNANNQVKKLYGNRNLQLVPPPEKKWGDSFFMQESKKPGEDRVYLGVMSTSLNAPETALRNMAVCLHASKVKRQDFHNQENYDTSIDPYWTILSYFNSVKELSYSSAQVTEIATQYKREVHYHGRFGYRSEQTRHLKNTDEITGRKKQYELNLTRSNLRDKYNSELQFQKAIDIVLATNMISVGVDVDRLGLMIINGFPKSTAEYIQASSRVGRKHPGLVITSYRSTKKRDLSHYENFISMHQSIYKYVEPISVSPFSSGAREKGLIGLVTAYLQFKNNKKSPSEYAEADLLEATKWVIDAVTTVYADDEQTIAATKTDLKHIKNKWLECQPKKWGKMVIQVDDGPYLCSPYTGVEDQNYLFNQLTSLRNVGRELTVFKNENKRRKNRFEEFKKLKSKREAKKSNG